ncbi:MULTISPECIES: hypothetical protein [unclassified Lentimicrobium]|uniref:hypothetical protein n=1 Tax=unclassified Lentimicrobium TaxID=2677434 RepID=UPI0015523ABB|nr:MULTISPECIES: hypothetical protein [unclassified Lentimicrobium]NPD85441.1 hypothetical protein [Lentimicrobium sp. L6]
MLDSQRVGSVTPDVYWNYINEKLDNPEEIWADYFQNQADDPVRALTFLTVFNNGRISESKLQEAYNKFIKIHAINLGDHSDKSFNAIRRLATKSLLNRNQTSGDCFEYTLFNPSIADFIINTYFQDTELITNILKSLGTEDSIIFINTLYPHKNKKGYKAIQKGLFDHFFDEKLKVEDWDFLILLCYLDFFNQSVVSRIEYFLKTIIKTKNAYGNKLSELLYILSDFEPRIKIDHFDFLAGFLDEDLYTLDEDTLKEILDFIEKYNIDNEDILRLVENQIQAYLYDIAKNNDFDIDFYSFIKDYSYPNSLSDCYFDDYEIDESGIELEIVNQLETYLVDFNSTVLQKIEIDYTDILRDLDPEKMANDYIESQDHSYDNDVGVHHDRISTHDDIDAIFERQ